MTKGYKFQGASVTWREYVDLRFTESQRAIEKAEDSINERLAGMNEFRAALKDKEGQFATKDALASLEKKVDDLRLSEATLAGKASQGSANLALLLSLLGLAMAVYRLFV